MTYSYNQPHPDWTAPTAAHHILPAPRKRREWVPSVSVLALALAAGAFILFGMYVYHSGTTASANSLQHQIRTLQQQVTTLNQQHAADAAAIHGQAASLAALHATVGGMTTTVRNLAPFTSGVCSGPFVGSKGAYTAEVPCKPLPPQARDPR